MIFITGDIAVSGRDRYAPVGVRLVAGHLLPLASRRDS